MESIERRFDNMKTLKKIWNFIISLVNWIRRLYMNSYECVTDVTETLIMNASDVVKECDDDSKKLLVKTICAVLLIGVLCIPLRLYLNYRLDVIHLTNEK